MYSFLFLLIAACLPAPAAAAPVTPGVAALLRQADAWRLPDQAARVETLVELYKHDRLDKERRYTVYVKSGRRSLVLMRSPAEAGQKVLMLAEHFWLLMPDSQRPLRITPNQKLLGEAATGDVATLTWSEDYDGTVDGEEEVDGRRCLRLDLAATRPGVTYARIVLWLDRASKQPVKADLYVHSGKRAKQARYETGRLDGLTRVVAMTLLDDIQTSRRTVIRYLGVTAKEAPDEFFNPAALARNGLAGW